MVTGIINFRPIGPLACGWGPSAEPLIDEYDETFASELIKKILVQNVSLEEAPEEEREGFWAARSIFYFALQDNFVSMTKLPFVLTESRTLFVQRDKHDAYVGFFAPFLSEEERREKQCIEKADQSDEISTSEEMLKSIAGEEMPIQQQLAILLTYFLQDDLAAMIGFTYKRANGEQTTRFWYKKSAIEACSTQVVL